MAVAPCDLFVCADAAVPAPTKRPVATHVEMSARTKACPRGPIRRQPEDRGPIVTSPLRRHYSPVLCPVHEARGMYGLRFAMSVLDPDPPDFVSSACHVGQHTTCLSPPIAVCGCWCHGAPMDTDLIDVLVDT